MPATKSAQRERRQVLQPVRHPAGGWTLAVPCAVGTGRIYRGLFPTRGAAVQAALSIFFRHAC